MDQVWASLEGRVSLVLSLKIFFGGLQYLLNMLVCKRESEIVGIVNDLLECSARSTPDSGLL